MEDVVDGSELARGDPRGSRAWLEDPGCAGDAQCLVLRGHERRRPGICRGQCKGLQTMEESSRRKRWSGMKVGCSSGVPTTRRRTRGSYSVGSGLGSFDVAVQRRRLA